MTILKTGRVRRSLSEDGLVKTGLRALRWLAARPRILAYEPATVLSPAAPSETFDGTAHGARIAVQIHVYYLDLLDEMIAYTNHIPYRFDCYLSTNTPEEAEEIRRRFTQSSRAEKIEVSCYENRGRDVAPFLQQLAPVLDRYDYLLHLHTKGSKHDGFGEKWRRSLLESLLESAGYTAAILQAMEQNQRLGYVYQRAYWRVKPYLGWRGNREQSEALMRRIGITARLPRKPTFSAGDMFWARTDAVAPLFQCGLQAADFPEEANQLDGTLAHCIERCWTCVAASRGYESERVRPRKQRESAGKGRGR